METVRPNVLSITYEANDGFKMKSINDSMMSDILRKPKLEVADVSIDIVKENMRRTLDGVMGIFESQELENRKFSVDEIEIALNVGCEGSVSILSAVSGQANMQSSIVVKLKRRSH